MADNRINLTPRQILSHLLDVERIAPRKEYHIYIPTKVSDSDITNDVLANEARKMIESVGLYNLEYDITYAKTAEGTAGYCLNNGTERSVHIQVSDVFRNNWKSSVAILAHEICHKILFFRGLYKPKPFEIMNEVYAELATIYFGFGEIILSGYNTNNHCLGYLTADTFKNIHLLVCVICGNIQSSVINLQDIDPLVDIAVDLWESEDDKRKLLKECFAKAEQQVAEYHKNIQLVEQILNQCKEDAKKEFERLDKVYFKDFNNAKRSSLETFLCIYDNFCLRDHHSNRIAKLNDVVCESLFNLYSSYQEQGNLELKIYLTCPKCGLKKENKFIGERFVVLKCGKTECGIHCTYDTEPWNATAFQRIVDKKRKAAKESFDRKVNESVRMIRRDADEQIRAIRSQARKEIDEIKRNERQRAKEEFLSKTPYFLRWIIAKYIK